jgi:hypothetical protein
MIGITLTTFRLTDGGLNRREERKMSKTLSCVTCHQSLPEGTEPEYFAQSTVGYCHETEADRAAEDVSQYLHHAQTVSSTVWDTLTIAELNYPLLPLDKKEYLDHAYALCGLLEDLMAEATRRAGTLSRLLWKRLKQEEAAAISDQTAREGEEKAQLASHAPALRVEERR